MVDFWRGEFIFFKTRLKFLPGLAARLNRWEDFGIGIEVASWDQNVADTVLLKAKKEEEIRPTSCWLWSAAHLYQKMMTNLGG
jgi:hypothetical protein